MTVWAQRSAAAFHQTLPGFRATPLVGLPDLAAELQVGHVWVKDESDRLGLPAFKILGASWAANRALSARAGLSAPAADLDRLRALIDRPTVLVTATDGNHGRAVARMAAMLGVGARVHVPSGLARSVLALVASEGAEVVETGLDYDGAVRHAAASTRGGDVLVQDTAWPGYEQIPQWVVDGYDTLFAEVDREVRADLVVVPTGVGSLLQAALQRYRAAGRGPHPAVLAVEPVTAACVTRSLAAGKPVTVDTSLPTIMAGLNCGTVSAAAWPLIAAGLDAGIAISDDDARTAVADLQRLGIDAGPCGAAALAGARAALADPARRATLGVGPSTTVVLISTEGGQLYRDEFRRSPQST
jgi:diaminopropionate ammonia-lyase